MTDVNRSSAADVNEACLFQENATLYRFDEAQTWRMRGKGEIKILQHSETPFAQIVFRERSTLKVRLNHRINPVVELRSMPGNDCAWSWSAHDYSGEAPALETFSIKFTSPQIAGQFKTVYDVARENGSKAAQKKSITQCISSNTQNNPTAQSESKSFDSSSLILLAALGAGVIASFIFFRSRR